MGASIGMEESAALIPTTNILGGVIVAYLVDDDDSLMK